MGVVSPLDVEEKIRTLCLTKRLRPSEFFIDYDRLRSGYVTESQFLRCLWMNLGLKFTPAEESMLKDRYDIKRNGRLSWKQFANAIEKYFSAGDLTQDPTFQKVEPREFLGTERSVRPLSPASENKILQTLQKMIQYYKYHGINLRTCYEDFDVHHIGRITESQFFRSFPGPPDVDEEEITRIVKKYGDPCEPGLVVYLNLHHDLMAIGDNMDAEQLNLNTTAPKTDYIPADIVDDPSLQAVFDRLRVAVFKYGIRTPEFFKDHDRLRSGIVTENQFLCGLSLGVGKEAQLTRMEMQKIVNFYKTDDGRVKYKEFTDMMENALNIPDLDKKPTLTPIRPKEGSLNRMVETLCDAEESRLKQVLSKIREQVNERRIMMYQYFKDYDRSRAYTRVMTALQFRRMLHFLTINVTEEDYKLLCKKYRDESTGDINYPAFVQSIDDQFVGFTIDSPPAIDMSSAIPGTDGGRMTLSDTAVKPIHSAPPAVPSCDTSNVDMESLIARIRHHVLVNRLRIIDYFQDFDSLRSGSISKSQFRRGLSSLGLSKLGHHDLIDPQFAVLCMYYENPRATDKVMWTRFMSDVESVLNAPGLEKTPDAVVPPSEIFHCPKPGTINWSNASDEHKQLVAETMYRLNERAEQRRVLLKPVFQDFDLHNNGHITRVQFRQALTMLELHTTPDEMAALEAKYCNDTGFNYSNFLADLVPQQPPKFMYLERLKELRLTNEGRKLDEIDPAGDLEALLLKMKTKVTRDRVRVHEWLRDYDKLRSGRMHKLSFRRALDLCKFELKESEFALLEDKFASAVRDHVDWMRFSDEIESIFTVKELEKAPLLEVEQFSAPTDWQMNSISEEEQKMCVGALERLSDKVRQRRMQLYPLFEDFDRVHNGFVSASQFKRVLMELELWALISEQEADLITERFRVKKGLRHDVDYPAFCDCVYDLCKFEWRKP